MEFLETITVDSHFRNRVAVVAEHLGGAHVVSASPAWYRFVDQLELSKSANGEAVIVVGPPAAVLAHATKATQDFGFVAPIAQLPKRWQRACSWRDDTTLDLWVMGWTPITIDRLLVATHVAPVEFVIGSARRTPTRAGAVDALEAE